MDSATRVQTFDKVVCVSLHVNILRNGGVSPSSVVDKILDSSPEVNKFDHNLRYYVYFRTDTLGKGMKPFIP